MDKKTQESVRKYNKIAVEYDDTFDGKFTRCLKNEIVRVIRLDDSNKVLDVVCGNGTLLKLINDKIQVQAYGVDISDNMIKEAKRKYPEMQFVTTNSALLPFQDNSFDAVTVCAAFHHFTEPDKFLKEAKRVLKPGGYIYIADPYFPLLIRQFAKIIFPLLKMGDVKIYNKRELNNFLNSHGFLDVSVNRFGTYGFMAIGKK
ncbi:MAG: class I SAM-dependent methyltransferase [Mobilitalea sp.]